MTIAERKVLLVAELERSANVTAEFERLLGEHLAIVENELRRRFGDDLGIEWE